MSDATGKPILVATELAVTDPDNPGPAGGARDRAVLRVVGEPRRHRARAPLAVRARHRATDEPHDVRRRGASIVASCSSPRWSRWSSRSPATDSGAAARRPRRRPRRPRCGRCAASREPVVDAVGAQRLQARARRRRTAVRAPASSSTAATTPSPRTARDTPLIGASTQKLLVAAAALSILGPDTTLPDPRGRAGRARRRHRRPDVAGRRRRPGARRPATYPSFLQSQAKTKGDVTTSLEALADAIVAKGVRRIPGGIVGDDSRYDAAALRPDVEGAPTAPTATSVRSARSP